MVACLAALACAAGASAQERTGHGGGRHEARNSYADPSAVIAAELAFARLAQDKGQWTAFRATAAADAMMFAPQPVNVAVYLKDRPNPPVALRWQPHEVWMSCDGSIGVTRGAWQRAEANGYFITVWQRQRKGGYKWLLDQGDDLAQPMPAPEMIAGKTADCPPRRRDRTGPPSSSKPPPLPPIDPMNAASDDGTLRWTNTLDTAGARAFSLRMRGEDGELREVLHAAAKAPGAD